MTPKPNTPDPATVAIAVQLIRSRAKDGECTPLNLFSSSVGTALNLNDQQHGVEFFQAGDGEWMVIGKDIPKQFKARGAYGYGYGDTPQDAVAEMMKASPIEEPEHVSICRRVDTERGRYSYPESARVEMSRIVIRKLIRAAKAGAAS